jgi:hypothetical protein
MPYVTEDRRADLDAMKVGEVEDAYSLTPGDLNYLMTRLAIGYVNRKVKDYTTLNDVMGVFASAQAEFYRRVVAPYEDEKIAANGDVY